MLFTLNIAIFFFTSHQASGVTTKDLLQTTPFDWLKQIHQEKPEAVEEALQETLEIFNVLNTHPRTTLEVLNRCIYRLPIVPFIYFATNTFLNPETLRSLLKMPNMASKGASDREENGILNVTNMKIVTSVALALYSTLPPADKNYIVRFAKSFWLPTMQPWDRPNLVNQGLDNTEAQTLQLTFYSLLKMKLLSKMNPEFRTNYGQTSIHEIIVLNLVQTAGNLGVAACLSRSNYLSGPVIARGTAEDRALLLNLHLQLPLQVKTYTSKEKEAIMNIARSHFSHDQLKYLQGFLNDLITPSGRRNTVFFLGGAGTGKTYTAKKIAEIVQLPIACIQWSDLQETSPHVGSPSHKPASKLLEAFATKSQDGQAYQNAILYVDEGDHCLQENQLLGEQWSLINQFLSEEYWIQHKLNYPICIKHLNIVIAGNRLPLSSLPNNDPRKKALLSRMDVVQFPAISEEQRIELAWGHFAKHQYINLKLEPRRIDKIIITHILAVFDGFIHAGVRDLERSVSKYLQWRSGYDANNSDKDIVTAFLESSIFKRLAKELLLVATDPVSGQVDRIKIEPFEDYLNQTFQIKVKLGQDLSQRAWKSVVEGASKPDFFE